MERNGIVTKLKKRLGTHGPGVTIAIIALVVALTGGAYAAVNGGLTGKQKKEVEKIAKKSGKPGATGQAGSQGPAGAKGDPGAQGNTGPEGKEGKPGTSVTTAAYSGPECAEGGTEVKSASPVAYICNGKAGKEGSPWTDKSTLPPGATETGTFLVKSNGTEGTYSTTLGLPIKLAASISSAHIFIQGVASAESFENECVKATGQSHFVNDPTAKPGVFCVYVESEGEVTSPELWNFGFANESVTQVGAILQYHLGSNGFAWGSFATTGCKAGDPQFPCP